MKTAFLIFLLAVSGVNAQHKFQFNSDISVDFVFYPLEGNTASDIYQKTLRWVAEKYKNPNAVKAKIQNKSITIDGMLRSVFEIKSFIGNNEEYDAGYTMLIEMKDNQFEILYKHNAFEMANGNPVSFTLKDIVANTTDEEGNDYKGLKVKYEESVQSMMNSLYMFIVTH